MGDVEKTVKILFQGDDQVSSIVTGIADKMGSFGDIAGDIASPWAAVAENILAVDAALAAMAVGGLAYAFVKSTEFESAVIDLNKVLGENPTGLNAAADAAINLSNQYGKSSTEILSSTAGFKQAGYDIQEAMQLTKNAMDLVIVGDVDAAEASSLLISTLKGFNEPASEAARLIDILNETSNNYATNVEELANGMARVSPIASQMGFSMEETAGLLTPIIEVFRSGDEAANGLRTGLLKLTDDSKPVRDALEALGVSQTNANGTMKTGKEIFYEVAAALSKMDASQRSFITQQLVGIEQAPKMSLLFSDLSKVLDITKTAMDSAGSSTAELEVYMQSSKVAVERFTAGFENLAIKIGDQFRDATKEAVNGGTAIEIALQGMIDDGTFDDVFKYINNFASDLKGILESVAKNLPEAMENVDFSGLFKALDGLKTEVGNALSGIWDDVDLTTPEGLTIVVQKVIDGFTALIHTTSGIVSGLEPMFTAIGYAIDHYDNLDASTQSLVGTFLGAAETITMITEHLDLLGLAIVPLAGASMVNAIANVSSFIGLGTGAGVGAITALSTAATGLGVALAAAGSVAGAGWLGEKVAELTAAAETSYPQVEKLKDAAIEMAGWTGDFSIIKGVSDLSGEAMAAAGKFVALKETISDLPESVQTEILSIFGRDGYDAAVSKLHELEGKKTETTVDVNISGSELAELYNRLADIPEEKLVTVRALMASGDYQTALNLIRDIPTDTEIEIKTKTDSIQEAKNAWQTVKVEMENGAFVEYKVGADATSITNTKKQIDEGIEKEKTVKIQAELDKAKLEVLKSAFSDVTDVMNTQIEWDAKLNIAALEAETEQVKAAFESIGSSVSAVSDTVSTMFTGLADSTGTSHFYELLDLTEKELDLQEKLIDAQVRLTNAQSARIESGEGIKIAVESSSLAPALEMIFAEIMEMAQVTANAEGLSLLGVS